MCNILCRNRKQICIHIHEQNIRASHDLDLKGRYQRSLILFGRDSNILFPASHSPSSRRFKNPIRGNTWGHEWLSLKFHANLVLTYSCFVKSWGDLDPKDSWVCEPLAQFGWRKSNWLSNWEFHALREGCRFFPSESGAWIRSSLMIEQKSGNPETISAKR